MLPLAPLSSRVAPETIPFQSLAEGAGRRNLVAQVPAVLHIPGMHGCVHLRCVQLAVGGCRIPPLT